MKSGFLNDRSLLGPLPPRSWYTPLPPCGCGRSSCRLLPPPPLWLCAFVVPIAPTHLWAWAFVVPIAPAPSPCGCERSSFRLTPPPWYTLLFLCGCCCCRPCPCGWLWQPAPYHCGNVLSLPFACPLVVATARPPCRWGACACLRCARTCCHGVSSR